MPPKLLISIKAVIVHQGKFLILKQTRPNLYYWDLPGGRMEYGETPQQTLKREVKEETAQDLIINNLLGIWWFFSPTQKHHVVCITYKCKTNHAQVDINKNPDNRRIQDYKWVTKDEFIKNSYAVLDPSLNDLIKTL